jgi:predicted negative regulator of RcsB-dependent stress response
MKSAICFLGKKKMAAFDLEEQEQISEIKTWWRMYGKRVIAAVLVAAVAGSGWLFWSTYQRSQANQAAAIYTAMQKAVGEREAKRVSDAAEELIEKFPGTAYAAMGALTAARQQFDAGDLKAAKLKLQWVADKARDAEMRDLGRLRLAHVLFDEKDLDGALKLLNAEAVAAYAPRLAELKGDILAAQGKKGEARAAYQLALSRLDGSQKAAGLQSGRETSYRDLLQTKADALGDK